MLEQLLRIDTDVLQRYNVLCVVATVRDVLLPNRAGLRRKDHVLCSQSGMWHHLLVSIIRPLDISSDGSTQ